LLGYRVQAVGPDYQQQKEVERFQC
jgi:hypothetical protein